MAFNPGRFERLNASGLGQTLVYRPATGSTNTVLKELAGAAPGTVVLADTQSAGRGRLDRVWVDEPGKNLLFSVLDIRPVTDKKSGLIPLLTSLAIVRTIGDRVAGAGIKWPNDVVHEGRKLAGILVEARTTGSTMAFIIGIGLNVNQVRFSVPGGVEPVSLAQLTGHPEDRERLLADLLMNLELVLRQEPVSDLLMAYRSACVTTGQTIRFTHHGEEKVGFADSVDDEGRLVIHSEGHTLAYQGNEIFHIRVQP